MRVIVSDTSCVIDLHKAGLLEEFVCLPESTIIPQPLFEDEALSINKSFKQRLIRLGLEVRKLPGEDVAKASEYFNKYRRLKIHDCFALVVAETIKQSLLLTGDKRLKTIAKDHDIRSHGVLWATDRIYSHKICTPAKLRKGLRILRDDPLVYVPDHLIQARIDDKYK